MDSRGANTELCKNCSKENVKRKPSKSPPPDDMMISVGNNTLTCFLSKIQACSIDACGSSRSDLAPHHSFGQLNGCGKGWGPGGERDLTSFRDEAAGCTQDGVKKNDWPRFWQNG